MVDHLSDLALDELAAGLREGASATAHVDTCVRCRDRLAEFQRAHADARRAPRFETTFARIEATATKRKRGRWSLFAALPVAAAAMLALVMFARPDAPTVRLKGAAELVVLRASGTERIESATPGEQVQLAVGAAGHPYAVVLAVEETGEVSVLWPQGADTSARVPPGAEVKLSPTFEVTEGSITLHALFSEEPLAISPEQQALRQAIAEAMASGRSPLEVTAPKRKGVEAVARRMLRVEPRR